MSLADHAFGGTSSACDTGQSTVAAAAFGCAGMGANTSSDRAVPSIRSQLNVPPTHVAHG